LAPVAVPAWNDLGVPDSDLTRLGSRAFEQLVVSLCRREVGPGMQVFGDGPDGGREATFDGTIQWSRTAVESTATDDTWSGYTVLQSKFMLKPDPAPRVNAVWLQGQIRDEIKEWTQAAESRSRDRLPDYLIFLTNVDLSPVAPVGGIHKVETLLAGLIAPESDAYRKGLRVKAAKIWHADQVRAMLDAHQDVRWAFPGLLTSGDVIASLLRNRPDLGSLDLDDPLRSEMVAGLAADRWLRLSPAGSTGGDKITSMTSSWTCPRSSTRQAVAPAARSGRQVRRCGDRARRRARSRTWRRRAEGIAAWPSWSCRACARRRPGPGRDDAEPVPRPGLSHPGFGKRPPRNPGWLVGRPGVRCSGRSFAGM
jgi:hypothetical protein